MTKPKDIQKQEDIYTAVGRALSAWSLVEEHLCLIFTRVTISDPMAPTGATMAAFWAIESFRGKLNAVDAALRLNFSKTPSIIGEWERLYKRAREKNNLRNDLAHGIAMIFSGAVDEVYFLPSFFKTRLIEIAAFDPSSSTILDIRPKNRLTAKQINDRTQAFNAFRERLDRFQARVYDEVQRRRALMGKLQSERPLAKG